MTVFREDDPGRLDPKAWLGKNWLGEVLTSVRETLLADASEYFSADDPREP